MNAIPKNWILVGVLILLVGAGGGYLYGNKVGYNTGYKKGDLDGREQASVELKGLEEAAAKKAAAEAAKAANPFQAVNPLEGVEANPFQKAKKILNPF